MHKQRTTSYGLVASLVGLCAPSLLVPARADAQQPPPEPAQDAAPPEPPPPPAPDVATPDDGYGWNASAEASAGADTGSELDAPAADATLEGDALLERDTEPLGEATPEEEDEDASFRRWRRAELHRAHNSLRASTGLLRVRQAGSGPQGSFRVGVYAGLYTGGGFLCTNAAPCFDRVTGDRLVGDDVDRMAANFTISATPWPFLEAFFGLYNTSTSNSLGRPQLLQVLGDANLGVKVFTPDEADQIFSFGGEAELLLLNGTGGVGLDGSGTSFALRALGTADLSNRKNPEERLPLRAHMNVGYLFDNSANVVDRLENTAPPGGRGQPIERIERFGLGISRVDSFQIGLGAEYLADSFRPFAEWSVDVPVNRQDYVCNIQSAESRGDRCLGAEGKLSNMPSRLSLGTRIYPWQDLAFTAAVDIATGGSTRFLEETTPQLPYTIWLGVAYAIDTQPPPAVGRVRPAPVAEPRRYVEGTVVDSSSGSPIADAILRYEGQQLTGMVADAEGGFRSTDLAPGTYTFTVDADGYKPGSCEATVPSSAEDAVAPRGGASAAEGAPHVTETGDLAVPIECKLDPLPQVATITGVLVDTATGESVARATVKVTDKLDRELELTADDTGAFQFRNVPFGRATVTAHAAGYLPTVMHFEIASRKDIEARLSLNRRPEQPNVEVTDKEVKLKRQVHFLYDSAEILPDSMAILEEIAEALKAHPEITRIEIQGHTDNTGQAEYNRGLSHRRAESVRQTLTRLGIASDRLVAKGYGPDKPLVPNSNNENRARNRRVQLIVLDRASDQ